MKEILLDPDQVVNLKELVREMSQDGLLELSEEDIRQIHPRWRAKAADYLGEIILENAGIEPEEEDMKVSLEEKQNLWDSLSDDEKEGFLIEFEDDLKEIKTEEGIQALPNDILAIVNMSAQEFGALPEEGRNMILLALEKIQEKENIPK